VSDLVVWNALCDLAGADLKVNPLDLLRSEDDFREWLDRLEAGGDSR
jgi:hypothetical protein